MKVIKIISRVLAFPFVFGIILVGTVVKAAYVSILFLVYGVEWTSYRKDDQKTIFDIYQKLSNGKEETDKATKD